MKVEAIAEILEENLELYDRALSGIKQCLAAYEKKCHELITLIADCKSLQDADVHFDTLYEIQGQLAGIFFSRKISIGSKLEKLTKEFDRLHDPYVRDYWLKRFHAGERWPT